MMPQAGDVLRIGIEASVQFGTPILFRVIRALDLETYYGWVWLDGYELNTFGDAVERRSIFVQISGLHLATPTSASKPRTPAGNQRQLGVARQHGNQPAAGNTRPNQAPRRA